MSRFSAVNLLFTILSILIWATQVNTPFHSDLSLRIVEVIPPVYPPLTISGPLLSVRSQCTSAGSCDHDCGITYKTYWTSKLKIAGGVKLPRTHLYIRACIAHIANHAHQLLDKLGQPTPKQLIGLLPFRTTGWLTAPPLRALHVDKIKVLRPTRTLPETILPTWTRTIGSSNLSMPKPRQTRPLSMSPIVDARIDVDDRFLQRWLIGATFVLTFASFLRTLTGFAPLVNHVDYRQPVPVRDIKDHISTSFIILMDFKGMFLTAVAPVSTNLSHGTKEGDATRAMSTPPTMKDLPPQLQLLFASLVLTHSEPIGGVSSLVLVLIVWSFPLSTPTNVTPAILKPNNRISRRTSTLETVHHIQVTHSLDRFSTKRYTLLLEWYPANERRGGPTRTGVHLPKLGFPYLLFNQLYAQPTSPNPYNTLGTLLLPTKPKISLPEELRLGVAPHHRPCIEWYTPVPTVERSTNILEERPEEARSSLCQYESYRPPNLGKYPPKERTRVHNREVRLAQKLQERRRRRDKKEGKVGVKPEPPAWMAVWMEMMKHGCIPGRKEQSEEWALRSIVRWEGTVRTERKEGRAKKKKVMWADEV
ncbi:unnamed protein product [Rhizoctonia solani]|uniref:Uncharacterized protein n=1 Tax=Rhizoctonia solani TaxID=456999 RepID=A0A8H3CR52_9AGAM|nr:unnamed protein product [Rhizoctonia solani]